MLSKRWSIVKWMKINQEQSKRALIVACLYFFRAISLVDNMLGCIFSFPYAKETINHIDLFAVLGWFLLTFSNYNSLIIYLYLPAVACLYGPP